MDPAATRVAQKVEKLLADVCEQFLKQPEMLPNFYMQTAYTECMDRAIVDYISGMSDAFANRLFEQLFVHQKWHIL